MLFNKTNKQTANFSEHVGVVQVYGVLLPLTVDVGFPGEHQVNGAEQNAHKSGCHRRDENGRQETHCAKVD